MFDVSQTEGKELPSMAHDLEGNINDYPLYMQALKKYQMFLFALRK